MKKIIKPWGYEKIIESNNKYLFKKLYMKKNHQCSLQFHKYKTETLYVLSGILEVTKNKKKYIICCGDSITISKNNIHRMKALSRNTFYLECSTPHPKDVVRVKDDYNRI